MSLPETLQSLTTKLAWTSLGLTLITLLSFIINWSQRFRLVGITGFTILLAASCWAFGVSYTPPVSIEGALNPPIVFDNGVDLLIAQAPADFPEEAIWPTLNQIAGNIRGGRNGADVHVRLRQILPAGEGISQPVILGEVVRDLKSDRTIPVEPKSND